MRAERKTFSPPYGVFIFMLILAAISFADVELILETETVQAELNAGSFMEIGAQLINHGECPVDCMYRRTSFDGDDFNARVGEVLPGHSVDFAINLMVPSCEDPEFCEVPVTAVCKELISDSCGGARFVEETAVSFTSVLADSEMRVPDAQDGSDERISKTETAAGTSGKFDVVLQMDSIDALEKGEESSNTATIFNTGFCPIRCVYKVQGENYGEELISERLSPGSKINFNIVFSVPEFCKNQCSIVSHITCYQLQAANGDPACESKELYEADVSFELTNVLTREEGILGYVVLAVIGAGIVAIAYFGFRFASQKMGKGQRSKEDEEGKRKLSAIIFTDMKGFSREVGRDEEATLKKMWRYEKVMKQIIKEHEGRVVKTIGDAIMGDFDSAVHAVRAAVEIQDLLKKEDIKIRVGIHLGDVIHKGGDIFGDGVNIASRLESICEPGEIYISEDVYNQVRGKIRAEFESLGRKPLKNIEVPPKVFKIKR